MTSALQRIKRIRTQLFGQPEDVQQSYEFTCDCGEVVRGDRRPTWIEVECPHCCASHFLLPHNVYPSTAAVPNDILGGSFTERLAVVVSELRPDRRTKDPSADRKGDRSKSPPATEAGADASAESGVRRKLQIRQLVPRIDLKRLAAHTFTPFRVLMLAIIAVVGLTIYWSGHQQQVEQARQDWLAAEEEISQYLSSGDFNSLRDTLERAVAAGEILDQSDVEWRYRRNLLLETEAVLSMAADNLLTAFHDVYQTGPTLPPDADRQLRAVATSGVFVFDSYLETSGSGLPTILFPATPGRHSVQVYAPFPELTELAKQSADGRILCAARIRELQAPTASGPAWQVLLDPDSFVLLTSIEHCAAVGLSPDEDASLSDALDRQREFVGRSASWEDRRNGVRIPEVFRQESP